MTQKNQNKITYRYIVGSDKNGKVTEFDSTTGEYVFTPNPGYVGKAGFLYELLDDLEVIDEVWVEIEVVPAGNEDIDFYDHVDTFWGGDSGLIQVNEYVEVDMIVQPVDKSKKHKDLKKVSHNELKSMSISDRLKYKSKWYEKYDYNTHRTNKLSLDILQVYDNTTALIYNIRSLSDGAICYVKEDRSCYLYNEGLKKFLPITLEQAKLYLEEFRTQRSKVIKIHELQEFKTYAHMKVKGSELPEGTICFAEDTRKYYIYDKNKDIFINILGIEATRILENRVNNTLQSDKVVNIPASYGTSMKDIKYVDQKYVLQPDVETAYEQESYSIIFKYDSATRKLKVNPIIYKNNYNLEVIISNINSVEKIVNLDNIIQNGGITVLNLRDATIFSKGQKYVKLIFRVFSGGSLKTVMPLYIDILDTPLLKVLKEAKKQWQEVTDELAKEQNRRRKRKTKITELIKKQYTLSSKITRLRIQINNVKNV